MSDATVVPTAIVDAEGTISELNDGRGRRLLETTPALVAYALGALGCELVRARFVWIDEHGEWWGVRLQQLPSAVTAPPRLLVELSPSPERCGLTPRELDVLTLIVGGLSNPEIAAQLRVSFRTVMTHVERVLAKLDQASRAGAAAASVELGLLRLPIPGGHHDLGGLPIAQLDAFVRRGTVRLRALQSRPTRPRPYLIGSVLPLSGPAGGDGIELLNGSRLAIAEINERGGIAGRPIEQVMVHTDISCSASVQTALSRLVDAEVDAITLGYSYELDVQDLAEVGAYGCPMLSNMTAEEMSVWVRAERDFSQFFQVGPTEIHYGAGCVRFLESLRRSGRWRPPNRGILFAETGIIGGRVAGAATFDAVERAGWRVDSLVQTGGMDFDPSRVLDQLHRSEPAAALLALYIPSQMAAFQRAFAADPTDTLIYGIYSPSVPEFRELAGPAAEGVVWSTVNGSYSDLLARRFSARYGEMFDAAPGRSLAGASYDQVCLLAEAWAHVGNPRAFSKVGDQLRRMTYRGVNGTYALGLDDRQCGISYPDETPDPSLGQAHLVFQVQDQGHRILHPDPYSEATFRIPPWFSASRASGGPGPLTESVGQPMAPAGEPGVR